MGIMSMKNNMDKILNNNFTKIGDNTYVTTERERVVMQLQLVLVVDH